MIGRRPVGGLPPPFEQVYLGPELIGRAHWSKQARQPEKVAGDSSGGMLVSEQGAKRRRRDPQLLGLFGFEFGNDDGGHGPEFL